MEITFFPFFRTLRAWAVGFIALGCSPAWAATFTNNTSIGVGDTNYDGSPIVITNCTVTLDGPHTFASVTVAAGGVLTHSFIPGGVISNLLFITNESQMLTGTNPVTLLDSNVIQASVSVTDLTGMIDYTNGLDYLLTTTNGILTELERTTNSSIPSGATVLVSYESLVSATSAGLDLTVTSNVTVDAGGTISANGTGYGGGLGAGAGHSAGPVLDGSGGGYGGVGGMSSSNAAGGATYGSYSQPTNLGSGGGASYAGPGGAGGGLIEIMAGGSVIVNGSITANGANGTNSRSGGGSGGGVLITALYLGGSGPITANGGGGEGIHGGGGGGGRIALQSGASSLTGSISAYGGPGAHIGGAGSVYTELTGESELLVIDNGGQAGINTILAVNDPAVNVLIRGSAIVTPSGAWSVGDLTIASNGLVLASPMTEISITSDGAVNIEAGGGLLANAAGSGAGGGLGGGRDEDSENGGGGYGGNGGSSIEEVPLSGIAYGSQAFPDSFGSGGGGTEPGALGGAGGGWIQITSIGGIVQVDGALSANGGNGSGNGGGGSGGTIVVTGGTWLGSGSVTANGGNGGGAAGGGGGGGRIAISPAANLFTGKISAYGGGPNWGGAGTILLTVPGQTAQLILDNNGNSGANTPVASANATDLIVRGGAIASAASSVTFTDLYLNTNGWIEPAHNSIDLPASSVTFTLSGNATIQAGGGIVADFAGYPAQAGSGEGGSYALGSTNLGGGGGHGGRGGSSFGNDAPGGAANDSATAPSQPGSGGGVSLNDGVGGGAGGGIVRLNVTGALELDGIISANGANGGSLAGGGGAGGSVWLAAGTLAGAGSIAANGGNGADMLGGGGGGGMIYIPCNNNSFAGTITAYGGGGANWGGAGTTLIQVSGQNAKLILDDGGHAGPATPLPSSSTTDLTLRNGAAGLASFALNLGNVVIATNAVLLVTNNGSTLNLTFASADIQPGGGIIADFEGYAAGQGNGAGHSSAVEPNYPCGGAGHGGNGASSAANDAAGGTAYDNATEPTSYGSAGGSESPYSFGGVGGGAFHLTVTGLLQNDGVISANGGNGAGSGGGGGAGGSIWLNVGTLSGAGSITANGGNGAGSIGGGGAGGCIALYPAANQFAGKISAYGGGGANWGGAGTIYMTVSEGPSRLILDNNGNLGTNTPVPSAGGTDLIVRGGGIASASSSVTFADLYLNTNGWIEPASTGSLPAESVTFSFTGNATIQPGGGIVADFAGYPAQEGSGEGATDELGSTNLGGGGGHGGRGGNSSGNVAAGGATYDTVTSPVVAGSGGGVSLVGGAGGGIVRLTVTGTLELDGTISANGANGGGLAGGGGAGGSVWLAVGTLAGGGSIAANGGNGADMLGGGGGGGMIYIPCNNNSFAGTITAYGGGGANWGGAGTALIQAAGQNAKLILDDDGHAGPATPLLSSSTTDLTLRNGAVGLASYALNLGNVVIATNAVLLVTNSGSALNMTCASADIQAGGSIIADFQGYPAGQGNGSGHSSDASPVYACGGAGHGGNGGNGAGGVAAGGAAYDNATEPTSYGSGGGSESPYSFGGAGGGAFHLTVTGLLQNDGVISANGGNGSGSGGGGGAGGSIWLNAGTLSGAGAITANGGNGAGSFGGGGAGGCIALYPAANQFAGKISAYGGGGANRGGAGTIYMTVSEGPAQLILDNNGSLGTNTPVPSAGGTDLIVRGGGIASASTSVTFADLYLNTNGWIEPAFGANLPAPSVTFTFTGNATIQPGGGIVADFAGDTAQGGSGEGAMYQFGSTNLGGGGGHGGRGGSSYGNYAAGGAAYDNATEPTSYGSGGGVSANDSAGGGAGGGIVRLTVTGTLEVDGLISANGAPSAGLGGGGGAGGSVWLAVGTLSGAGSISANGGNGAGTLGGGGGGGMIYIPCASNLFAGTITAYGGGGANWGGAGTVLIQVPGQHSQLVLDGDGHGGPPTPLLSSTTTDLTLRNGAAGLGSSGLNLGNVVIAANSFLFVTNNNSVVNMVFASANIQAGGGVIADFQGYPAGEGTGAGHAYGIGPDYACGGAGHGGIGANSAGNAAAGGNAYDNPTEPSLLGSGGGTESPNSFGGAGGGAFHLSVTGLLQNNGVISANGGNGAGSGGGGGAGGSIWLTAGALSGAGLITANGGNGASSFGGGGAGGCIALSSTMIQFAGAISAYGGGGANWGGAGIIYTQGTSNQFIVDNDGQSGALTPIQAAAGSALILRNGAAGYQQSPSGPVASLSIASNAWLTTESNTTEVNLTVTGNATIAAGGGIVADNAGSAAGNGPGAGFGTDANEYDPCSGAGYGGYGASAGGGAARGGSAYGSATSPSSLGSGGGAETPNSIGGAGGGSIRLNVFGTLDAEGRISANGGNGAGLGGGGGSGGSIWLTAGSLTGAGEITANGGSGANDEGGGGGGGRISIGYTANDFAGLMNAYGGSGDEWGGAGTIYTQTGQSIGALLLDNGGEAGTNTPLSSTLGAPSQPFNLTIQNGAIVSPQTSFPVLSNLVIAAGGGLTGSSTLSTLDVLVLGNVSVETGGFMAVDGEGYAQGVGPGAGQGVDGFGSGAGYGGVGGASAAGPGGASYGSSNQPVNFGSGGGIGYETPMGGSQGGGAIRLNVGGLLLVNGVISSDGEPGLQDNSGGGSGGSIWVTAGVLAGSGQFLADGGAGNLYDGGGGAGGRIALYSQLDAYIGMAAAAGAGGYFTGSAGTIYSNEVPPLELLSNSPSGLVSNAVSSLILYFNEAPNPQSFADAGLSLMTPNGLLSSDALTIGMLSSASYQVSFAPQTANGAYSLVFGTNIVDLYGQTVSPPIVQAFTIALPVIQGVVTDTNGNPVAGVLLQASGGLTSSATTDTNGNYVLSVAPGSSFTVTPSQGALVFVPPSLSYTNVTASIVNQNYLAVASLAPLLTGAANGANFVLAWQGLAGVNYQVYASSNLSNWQPYGGAIIGSNAPIQIQAPVGGASAQFFTVQAGN